jgi:hypothetical protein
VVYINRSHRLFPLLAIRRAGSGILNANSKGVGKLCPAKVHCRRHWPPLPRNCHVATTDDPAGHQPGAAVVRAAVTQVLSPFTIVQRCIHIIAAMQADAPPYSPHDDC